MIDFLLKLDISKQTIQKLLSEVFETKRERVLVLSMKQFTDPKEIDLSDTDCLCVVSKVSGDALLLLQLYRYCIDNNLITQRIIQVFSKNKVACYIPKNSFDEWYFVDESNNVNIVRQISENEDDVYHFNMI